MKTIKALISELNKVAEYKINTQKMNNQQLK